MNRRFGDYIKLNDSNKLIKVEDGSEINRFDSASKINYNYSGTPGTATNVEEMLEFIAEELWYINPIAYLKIKLADDPNGATWRSTVNLETGSIVGESSEDFELQLFSNKNDDIASSEIYFQTLDTTIIYSSETLPFTKDYFNIPGSTAFSSYKWFSGNVTDSAGTTSSNSYARIYFYQPSFYIISENNENDLFTVNNVYDDFNKLILNPNSTITFSVPSFDNKYIYIAHPSWSGVQLQIYSNISNSWETIGIEPTLGSHDTKIVSSNGLDSNWTKTYYIYRTQNKMGAPDSSNSFRISSV